MTLAVLQQNHLLFLLLHFQWCRCITSSHLVLTCSWKSAQQQASPDAEGGARRRRLQEAARRRAYRSTLECLRSLYLESGLSGWFCGLQSKLLQTVLTASLMFTIYERLALMTVRLLRA